MTDHSHEKPDTTHLPGIVGWFAHNHVAANILMIFLILAGALAMLSMVREIFPSIDPRMITVTVPYPGATPTDVEDGITRRIEEAVIGLQGVKRVESNAREGAGTVMIELDDFVDGNEVLNDVETEIDRLTNFPPENAEEVVIVKSKPRSNVVSVVVFGDVDPLALRSWAEKVEDDLLQLQSVSLVDIKGSRNREISIEVAEDVLRKHNLTLEEVAAQIAAFSTDLPGGTIRTRSSEIAVRVQERRYYGPEFADIVIRSKADGSFLRLGDMATIIDGFEPGDLITRYNGKPAVFIDISRSASQDSLVVDEEVRTYIQGLELPPEISVDTWKNRTDILRDRINLLSRNAILGYTLVFIALLLFLDLKLAFWTSLGIPISFLGGLLFASFLGVSINMVSLFALIVVLGIVVDDAIVTGESIFAEQEEGRVGYQAAMDGVKRVQAPVTIGVLTTVAAFAPLIFSTGTLGQILKPIPIVVISVLAVSLIEAFLILPAHLSSSTRWSKGYLAIVRSRVSRGLEDFIDRFLLPVIRKALQAKYISFTGILFLIVFAFFMVKSGQLRFIFFPHIEGDDIIVTLEMPVGTPYEVTEGHMRQIIETAYDTERQLRKDTGAAHSLFKNVSVTIGGSSREGDPTVSDTTTASSHTGQVQVELVPSNDRKVSSGDISRIWRSNLGEIPQAEKVDFQSSLIGGNEDVNVELSHKDAGVLDLASERLKNEIANIEGVAQVNDSLEPGRREFIFHLTNAGKAAGLTPAMLGRQLRSSFYGYEVDRVQRGSSEVKVMVRYPEKERETLATIDDIRIRLPNGERAAIDVVADIKEAYSPVTIKRVDGRRVVSIIADVDEDIITPEETLSQIEDSLVSRLKDLYPGLEYKVAGENEDQRNDLKMLGQNMLIALLVIFVMLGAQLRSYAKPFIILMTVPLGIAGAIYGHMLLGFDLSFVSLFGIVALTGVVINDSVVFVDYYNRLDLPPMEAALETVRRRFRPIMLTTLTTSLGLLPMLLETSLQAQFIIPMAVSLACGIVFASSLVIFMVPCLLLMVEDAKTSGIRMRKRLQALDT